MNYSTAPPHAQHLQFSYLSLRQSLESVTGSLFIFISKLTVMQSASTSFPTVNSMRTTICAMKKCTKHGCKGGAGKLANSVVSSLVFDSIQTAANNLNENILEMAMHLWTSQNLYFKTGAGAKSLVGKFSFFRMCVFALERFCRKPKKKWISKIRIDLLIAHFEARPNSFQRQETRL